MKNIILFHIWLILPNFLAAQKTQWYKSQTDTIPYELRVDVQEGKLIFTGRTEIDSTDYLPYISPFSLLDANIVFTSQSISKFKKHTRDSIQILSIRQKGEPVSYASSVGNIRVAPSQDQKNGTQYTILDAMENYLEYGKTYIIDIERSFYTDFDPNEPIPKMDHTWYIGAAVVGAGAVAYGFDLKKQANDDKKKYQANWREGRSNNESEQFYNDAKSKNNLSYIVMGAGVAILATDAVLYALQKNKWKKRQSLSSRLKERAKRDFTMHVFPSTINGSEALGWNVGATLRF